MTSLRVTTARQASLRFTTARRAGPEKNPREKSEDRREDELSVLRIDLLVASDQRRVTSGGLVEKEQSGIRVIRGSQRAKIERFGRIEKFAGLTGKMPVPEA